MNNLKHKLISMNKDDILKNIKKFLDTKEEILFAYIFGSFVEKNNFNDIDIAIFISDKYLNGKTIRDKDNNIKFLTEYEIKMEIELENYIHIPIDK